MPKWNERNRIEPIPPKLGARDTPPIAPETLRAMPEDRYHSHDAKDSTLLANVKKTAQVAVEAGFLYTQATQPVHPITRDNVTRAERQAPDRPVADDKVRELFEKFHEANDKEKELRERQGKAEQGMKQATKEATDKMHKGEIRETPPTKPPEKPAEKATSEVSKAQAEKQRVLAPDAKVVRSTVEPPRPVHRAPGIKEVDFSPKPQETKKEGTGKDGKEDPTKHKFETPDQSKPKPTIQGPKM